MLPLISGLVFKTLDTSYRKIFQLPSRHLLLGQAISILMSIFAVLLFFVLNFIWIILSASIPHFFSFINAAPYFTNIVSTTMIFVTYLPVNVFSGLVILLFYLSTIRLFLNIKIKYRYRFISGIIFCLLWLFARKIFKIFMNPYSPISRC